MSTGKNIPVFYDCEAAALDGPPIEIGWAYAEGNSIVSEAHLILPPSAWQIEEAWDPAAEALHGISVDLLRKQGKPVWEIAQRMNMVLKGRELFSDSPADEAWLRQMFDETGLDPGFTVRRTDAMTVISQLAIKCGLGVGAYIRAKTTAARLAPHTHRAESDARQLAILWGIVLGHSTET